MTYCSKCGTKNEDDAEFCKKCGLTLSGKIKKHESDDDCVCGSDKQNPFVSVFWGIVVILFGLWVIVNFVIPKDSLPAGLHDFTFWGFLLIVFALAIILTGFRILTKKK
jgi:ribosomal protein L40E